MRCGAYAWSAKTHMDHVTCSLVEAVEVHSNDSDYTDLDSSNEATLESHISIRFTAESIHRCIYYKHTDCIIYIIYISIYISIYIHVYVQRQSIE